MADNSQQQQEVTSAEPAPAPAEPAPAEPATTSEETETRESSVPVPVGERLRDARDKKRKQLQTAKDAAAKSKKTSSSPSSTTTTTLKPIIGMKIVKNKINRRVGSMVRDGGRNSKTPKVSRNSSHGVAGLTSHLVKEFYSSVVNSNKLVKRKNTVPQSLFLATIQLQNRFPGLFRNLFFTGVNPQYYSRRSYIERH